MPTYIHGIASSAAIDTAGEVVDIAGLDCSSLVGSCFNYEHESKLPSQILGKILEYKKIFSEKDCETDGHKYFWDKCKLPFLYVLGRLFDDKKESAKEVAALFIDDAQNPNEAKMVGFSIEGAKLEKVGMVIRRSIARKVTITGASANKTCIAEMIPAPTKGQKSDIDSLFKGEIQFFTPSSKQLESLEKKETELTKTVGSGGGAFIGSQLAMGEMNKTQGWSEPKRAKTAIHFSHPEHGIVSIHKQPEGGFHVKHKGALTNLNGVKGSFSTPQEAGKHARNYMSSLGSGKTLVSKTESMNKTLDAGSMMAAPSALVGGAALGKESVDKKIKPMGKKEICMPEKEFVDEHEKLVNTLKNPTPKKLKEEAREQGKELKEMKKSKWLLRAEQFYNTWEKREAFEKFMQERLPHLSKGEVRAIGQTLALKKSIKAESKLSKMFASHFSKADQMGQVPTSRNEANEPAPKGLSKGTDVMMASEKKK